MKRSAIPFEDGKKMFCSWRRGHERRAHELFFLSGVLFAQIVSQFAAN